MQWIITAGYFLSQMVSWEEKTQIGGFVIVCDTKGFGFRQFKAMGWSDLKFVFMLIQVWNALHSIDQIVITLKFDQIIIVGLLPLEVHGGSSGQFLQIRQLRLQHLEALGWPGTKGATILPHHYGVFAQTRGQVRPD